MKKDKIIVIFSSHLGEESDKKFIKHINNTIGIQHKVVCYPNFNQFSLPEVYNQAINEHNSDNAIMVFLHSDLTIKTFNWGKILLNHFNYNNYSIIGVAGTKFLSENGVWWNDRTSMTGIVEHCDEKNTWTNEYSSEHKGKITPTVIIDGLFMAVDCNNIEHKFDEEFKGYHLYDLSFVFPNYLAGCNIGVTTDIRILHQSMGMTNEQWELNRQQFANKYKEDLPARYISEDKLKVLICCQFFKTYTGSEMSNYELSKELVKLGCDVTLISSVVGEPLLSKAQKNGVKVFSFNNLPNYILDREGKLNFVKNEKDFDIIHINHKPIGELILKLYPNTPAVMHVRSEVIPVFEEPIINSEIKRYISIRDSITEYIKTFGVSDDKIVLIDNPFDSTRFNTNYKQIINEKEVILFIGTLDYLRKNILYDLDKITNENNQELWIIGADNEGYSTEFSLKDHIKYLGVKSNVEDFIKKCDYTAGIFKGRTTIEGFMCGKQGWIYTVDKEGNILNKELQSVPNDIEKYKSDFSAKKVFKLYYEILN